MMIIIHLRKEAKAHSGLDVVPIRPVISSFFVFPNSSLIGHPIIRHYIISVVVIKQITHTIQGGHALFRKGRGFLLIIII